MKTFKFIALFITILSISPTYLQSQNISNELISNSGDCFENSFGMIYWSIGECMTETYASGGTILTQGFHQAEPGYWIGILDTENKCRIKVYPNPFSDILFVESKEKDNDLKIVISDLLGSVVYKNNLLADRKAIDGSMLRNGLYILKIIDINNKTIQIIKIIKTK